MWAKMAGRTLAALDTANSEADAFDILVDYACAMGAELVSYHHVAPPFARPDGEPARENLTLLARGFPESWVEQYRTRKLHRIDPITSFAAYQTRPVRWSVIPQRVTLTPAQKGYLDDLYAWLAPGDGMAVPLFGPSGRHGYAGIGRTSPEAPWSAAQERTVQAVCEAFHLRFCEIRLAGLDKDFELTEREARILSAMSRGWSDPMIGATVGLRPDPLRSAIKRLLIKMGVLDRPSAVLRARALGLTDAD